MIICQLPRGVPLNRPQVAADAPLDRRESLPSDEALELMRQVRKAGYRFSLGGMPFEPATVDTARPPVGVTLEPTQKASSWLDLTERIPTEQVRISGWNQLRELAAVAAGSQAETLIALERAGAQLCVMGAADPASPTSSLKGIFPEPRPEGPRVAGALGVYLQEEGAPVFLVPPDGKFPTRLDSLETARYFVLGQGEPPGPQAARLRQLSSEGYGFQVEGQSVGALGAYLARGPVELSLAGHPIAPLDGERLQLALDYHRENPSADGGILRALALPGELPVAERLELHQSLQKALDRPRRGEFGTLRGTSMAGVDSEAMEKRLAAGQSARAARIMADLWTRGTDRLALVGLCAGLLENSSLRTPWAIETSPYLLEHPEARQRLVALGEVGGVSLADTLRADAELADPVDREAFLSLARRSAVNNLLEVREDPMVQALQAFEHLKSHRWAELSLLEDANRLGDLIKPLGLEGALRAREQLQPDQVEVFLREHKLARDLNAALACLQPGGNPALPEPLEQREEAERLVAPPFGMILGEEKDRAYDFLLGLPNRQPVPDAHLLVELRGTLPEADARALLQDFKAGKLDARTPEQLTSSFELERGLWGSNHKALASLRAGLPEPEERLRLLGRIKESLGEVAWDDWSALQSPLPPNTTLDQGLDALSRLRAALPPREAREAYTGLLQALQDGALPGRSLEEGVDELLRASLTGAATRALDPTPAASVRVERDGVTVGGVRLRTRS